MSTYLTNYWSLYRDFVETFNQLSFRKIPIVLLTNFYQQINEELKTKMEKEEFQAGLRFPVMEQRRIQPYFEEILGEGSFRRLAGGKTLIVSDYTRIPEQTYSQVFDSKETMILTRSKKTEIYGIPTVCMRIYEENDEQAVIELTTQATAIFEQFKTHVAFGNEVFQQTFLKRIPLIVKAICSAINLFDHVKISAVIVGTTEDMLSRALSIVGSMRGIKSICLQHGILMGEEAFMPVFTTLVGVYGEYERKWYEQRGVSIERIAQIGHPKFDEIFTHSPSDKATFFEKIGLDPDKLTLLVITGPNLDQVKFEELIKNIAGHSFQLLIKPHPWEMGKGKYQTYLNLEQTNKAIKVYTSRENNLYDLLSHVDGVVSSLSTVALESILFNVPVFLFNFLFSNRTYDYFDSFGAYIQDDPDVLSDILNQYYLSSEEREKYQEARERYVTDSKNDGLSGQRLVNLMK
ncbi:CDP-glycerol glycerophosphotransferase family protein [Peribacillus psychrosaccharolyticus]|uniref:CDP-glycerol glycerophosphotransferase family protein n=1 Tax=Peribacillus psychrosaccharolyticus TaxID=1407 RepID=A0A974NQA0_PERPY|nr:CDP-glycerol glycerophosphotransferase family protein [Peribacillus psychrosaccharolyticus]MEC2057801.1 CDP-glycerol glycerophosphotransferase family protein [Peribacillus psychrosaccharolyticus]MED3746327.1 CDP-glycerol glycerophosphotransferase family protein [Peribacillus psychrosaccharolyticus]QQT01876.1 CDP-glycerol glycerophosphotransferase family protein [Peribacillus psychrosaccharolyticus]